MNELQGKTITEVQDLHPDWLHFGFVYTHDNLTEWGQSVWKCYSDHSLLLIVDHEYKIVRVVSEV